MNPCVTGPIALARLPDLFARWRNRLAHGAGKGRRFHPTTRAPTDGRLKNNRKFSKLTAGTERKNKLKKNLRQYLYYPILLTRIRATTDLRSWDFLVG